jgi:hypothetical protein
MLLYGSLPVIPTVLTLTRVYHIVMIYSRPNDQRKYHTLLKTVSTQRPTPTGRHVSALKITWKLKATTNHQLKVCHNKTLSAGNRSVCSNFYLYSPYLTMKYLSVALLGLISREHRQNVEAFAPRQTFARSTATKMVRRRSYHMMVNSCQLMYSLCHGLPAGSLCQIHCF